MHVEILSVAFHICQNLTLVSADSKNVSHH